MEEVSNLLGRMLAKAREQTAPEESVQVRLTTSHCYPICDRCAVTPVQLMEAIKDYCFNNDINLERFDEVDPMLIAPEANLHVGIHVAGPSLTTDHENREARL